MNSVIAAVAIHYLTGYVADYGASLDPAKMTTELNAKIESAVPSKFVDTELESVADPMIAGVVAILKDQVDLGNTLKALAAKDPVAAKAALVAMLKPIVPPNVAALLATV